MEKLGRSKVTEIIEAEKGERWWRPEEFEKHIRPNLPKELRIVASPPSPEENYNCFAFVFGLESDAGFLGGRNPVQQEFIQHLLLHNILIVTSDPVTGDLVFYESGAGAITHGGIMQSADTVISKWMWGPTIIHNLWDVPSSFGDKVFFCKPVASNEIKDAYENYKNSGVTIQPIL